MAQTITWNLNERSALTLAALIAFGLSHSDELEKELSNHGIRSSDLMRFVADWTDLIDDNAEFQQNSQLPDLRTLFGLKPGEDN